MNGERPKVVIPDAVELQQRLSASHDIEARVRYVQGLLRQVEDVDRVMDNLEREIARQEQAMAGMRTELHSLRAQLGEVPESERARLKDRADMLTKLNKARGVNTQVRQRVNAALDLLDEALKR